MEGIDAVRVNFSSDQLVLLNILLGFLMLGVALEIHLDDFRKIFRNPRIPLVGLFSEYVLLPLLTLLMIFVFQPAPSIALGMILLAACPGGSVSNFMVHLSKSNSALSVMLTSITTLGAIIITPLWFTLWAGLIDVPETLRNAVQVNPWQMVRTVIELVFIPVTIGMVINHKFPKIKAKIDKPVRYISLTIFFGFVFFALKGNYDNIKNYLMVVFWIVLIHNGLAYLMGYYFAKAMRLEEANARTISIETGIQNTGLGLILVFNFFDGLGGMALVLAWWGVWHLLSGFLLATYWSKKRVGLKA